MKAAVIDKLELLASPEFLERSADSAKYHEAAKIVLPIAKSLEPSLFANYRSSLLMDSDKLSEAIYAGMAAMGITDEREQDRIMATIDRCSAIRGTP